MLRRYNVLALSHFPIHDPKTGGQIVSRNLYEILSKNFNIFHISIYPEASFAEYKINDRFFALTHPFSSDYLTFFHKLQESLPDRGIHDYIHFYIELERNFLTFIQEFVENYNIDIIVLDQPYLGNVLDYIDNKNIKVIYHAQNVEYLMKKDMYKISNYDKFLLNIFDLEKKVLKRADLVLVKYFNDLYGFRNTYSIDFSYYLYPNTIDTSKTLFIKREEHKLYKQKSEFFKNKVAVFVGSWHDPNLEAVLYIIDKVAPLNEDVVYIIVGSVCDQFKRFYPEKVLPKNVILKGLINNEEKEELYKLADVAINPMFSGGGTNVKIIEYMAYGLPILSTNFGRRGIKGNIITFESPKDFIEKIDKIDLLLTENDLIANRNIVKFEYDAKYIYSNLLTVLYELISDFKAFYIDYLSLNLEFLSDYDPIIDKVSQELSQLIF